MSQELSVLWFWFFTLNHMLAYVPSCRLLPLIVHRHWSDLTPPPFRVHMFVFLHRMNTLKEINVQVCAVTHSRFLHCLYTLMMSLDCISQSDHKVLSHLIGCEGLRKAFHWLLRPPSFRSVLLVQELGCKLLSKTLDDASDLVWKTSPFLAECGNSGVFSN